MFAAALRAWSRETLDWAAIYDPAWKPEQAQHVVVRLGHFFFDSDGMGTAEDLLLKFRHFERPVEVKLTDYDPDKEFVIPVQPLFVKELADKMQKAFGDFTTERLLDGVAHDACVIASEPPPSLLGRSP